MDDLKTKAYQVLNYQALLDIKNMGKFSEEKFWEVFHIAHTFHNLAEFIIVDFDGFDEEAFWIAIGGLERKFGVTHYRKLFKDITDGDTSF